MQIQFYDIIGIIFGAIAIAFAIVASKSNGFSLGLKIMKLSWAVFYRNRSLYLLHISILALFLIILPAICLFLFFNLDTMMDVLTGPGWSVRVASVFSFEMIYALFSIAVIIIWITMPFWFFLILMPAIITFLNVIFFKKLFESVSDENANRSYSRIFREELSDIPGILDLTFQKLWIRYYVHNTLWHMRRKFIFSSGTSISFSQYFSIAMVSSLMNYTSIDYAYYRSLPKHAVAKSYLINKKWSSVGMFGLVFSIAFYLLIFSLYIFLCQLIFILGSDYINFSDPNSILVYWIAAVPFVIIGTIVAMFFQTYYFILYISYNNSYVRQREGGGTGNDLTISDLGQYFDYVEDFLVKKLNMEDIPSYERLVPVKEEYRSYIDIIS